MVISPGPMTKCGDVSTVKTHSLYSLDKKNRDFIGKQILLGNSEGCLKEVGIVVKHVPSRVSSRSWTNPSCID